MDIKELANQNFIKANNIKDNYLLIFKKDPKLKKMFIKSFNESKEIYKKAKSFNLLELKSSTDLYIRNECLINHIELSDVEYKIIQEYPELNKEN